MNWEDLFAKRSKSKQDLAPLLQAMNFKKTFLIFNVVGTNGKGSVSTYLAQGLRQKYHRVGLFTSPHLTAPNERIQINGVSISDKAFWALYQACQAIKIEELNFFSTTYIIAMLYFSQQGCDFVVLEAGIGGAHDVTRTIAGDYGCVTSISLDHTELLGRTRELIAIDKAGIINKQMHFFIPTSLEDWLQIYFKPVAKKVTLIPNEACTYRLRNLNFATQILHELGINALPTTFTTPLGRTQVLVKGQNTLILDVGHNYDGIVSALEQIRAQKLSFSQVVLALKRTKIPTGISALFNGMPLFVYQISDEFYSAAELGAAPLLDLAAFLARKQQVTLYIGSFSLISLIFKYYAPPN